MGMTVKMEMGPDPGVTLHGDLRRGLIEAGHAIIALSDAQAPREDVPRHGVHMTETTFVAATVTADGEDAVVIGYGAHWALWQHENLDWHHDSGHAKFLELAVSEGAPAAFGMVAVAASAGLR